MLEKQTYKNWKAHFYTKENYDVKIRENRLSESIKNKTEIHLRSGN